jgi:hypothetical protein
MLRHHPDVVGIDETGLGHHLGVWRPIALAWQSPDPPELTTFKKIKESRKDYFFNEESEHVWRPGLERLFRERLEHQLDNSEPGWREDSKRVVIKEPGGSHMASELISITPGSRLVFLLRDGRDVVDSWLDAYREGTWASNDGAYAVGQEDRVGFIRWQAAVWKYRTEAVQAAYDTHDPACRIKVRYEDLLAEPVRHLGAILETLELDADPKLVGDLVEDEAHRNVPQDRKGSGHEIRFAKPGTWQENLTPEEVTAMEAILGDRLVADGYA